ncbi:MAG: N-acetylmuramoyl-L-alanine amidase [Verrucomicrobiota bacterium]
MLFSCILGFGANALAFNSVVIDAGHGGHDRGGIPGQQIAEKTLTLDVAQRLRTILREAGLRTVMTRNDDHFISLQKRVEIANAQRNAIFVSVHFNSAKRHGADGLETYYYAKSGMNLASRIQARLVRVYATENRGIKRARFFVLRKTKIPAVLAECGFLTNGHEGALCLKAAHRQRLAEALGRAILASR